MTKNIERKAQIRFLTEKDGICGRFQVICSNTMRKSLTASSTLKASADGSIVITLARLTLTILQAQSIAKGSIIEQLQNSLSGQKNQKQAR
jgi:hypothetical protein